MGLVCGFESLREPDEIRWLILCLVIVVNIAKVKCPEFLSFPHSYLNITPRFKIKADLEEARIEEEERLKVIDR